MCSDSSEFVAICAKLLKDKDFLALDTNESRISYIFKNAKPLQAFREDINKKISNYAESHEKSLKTSQKCREEGDNLLASKSYMNAIHCYTKALLYAPFPTTGTQCKELQKAYTARSLAFARIGDYDNSLFDAEKSLFLGSSVEMLSHKVYCLRFLRRFAEAKRVVDAIVSSKEYYKTQGPPEMVTKLEELQDVLNKEVIAYKSETVAEEEEREQDYDLWIHEKFELKCTPEKGRHLVAKESIKSRDVVIAEKPETAVLSAQNMTSFCSTCFKKVGFKFWPCIWCSEVVFCDRTCHDRGFRDFHQYECKTTGILLHSPLYQAFRIVTRIGAEYAFKTAQNTETPEFDLQKWVNRFYGRDCPVVYRLVKEEQKHHFEGLLSLVDHNEKVTPEEAVRQALMAIEVAIVCEYQKCFVTYEENTFVSFVAFLVKIFRKTVTNSFGLNHKNSQSPDGHYNVGSCVSIYGSFVNHSCVPNMSWFFFEDKLILMTTKEIEAGEELTICYGPNSWMPLEQRQTALRNHYHFSCGCDLCLFQVKKYPALKCLECEGPALYVPNTQRNDKNACLKCGTVYQNIKEVVNRIAYTRLEFEEGLKNVLNLLKPKEKPRNDTEDEEVYEENEDKSTEETVVEDNDTKVETENEEEESDNNSDQTSDDVNEIVEETQVETEISAETMAQIDSCLQKAEQSLQTLIDLHYSECEELMDLELKIAKVYIVCHKTAEAVKHTERFVSSVDWEKCTKSCRHWEALLFITNAYYLHLKDTTGHQKSDWKQCFKSFSALKESYKALKEDSEAVKALTVGQQSTDQFKDMMRQKKAHFSALKDVYRSLFTA